MSKRLGHQYHTAELLTVEDARRAYSVALKIIKELAA